MVKSSKAAARAWRNKVASTHRPQGPSPMTATCIASTRTRDGGRVSVRRDEIGKSIWMIENVHRVSGAAQCRHDRLRYAGRLGKSTGVVTSRDDEYPSVRRVGYFEQPQSRGCPWPNAITVAGRVQAVSLRQSIFGRKVLLRGFVDCAGKLRQLPDGRVAGIHSDIAVPGAHVDDRSPLRVGPGDHVGAFCGAGGGETGARYLEGTLQSRAIVRQHHPHADDRGDLVLRTETGKQAVARRARRQHVMLRGHYVAGCKPKPGNATESVALDLLDLGIPREICSLRLEPSHECQTEFLHVQRKAADFQRAEIRSGLNAF